MFFLGLSKAVFGATIFGLDHQPLSRGDLGWVEQDRHSSFLLAEDDQLLSTPSFWIAHMPKQIRYQLGLAAHVHSDFSSTDVDSRSTVGGVRLETDARYFFSDSPAFTGLGVFGTIPISSVRSTGYTEEEQDVYNDVARSWRAEIRSLGIRGSMGAEIEVVPQLSMGIRLDLSSCWSWLKLEQSGWERQFTLKSEPFLYFGIAW